jgi:hypothetical protein
MLADLDMVEKRLEKLAPKVKSGEKEAKEEAAAVEKLKSTLEGGIAARKAQLKDGEWRLLAELHLLTTKPVMYVCNVNETDVKEPSQHVNKVMQLAEGEGAPLVEICGSIEGELGDLETDEERKAFLDDLGLDESGLERVIHAGYSLLDQVTFFTKDGPEVRAWSVRRGTKAPQAAGKIHTDFEKGFVRAEVYSYDELMTVGDEHKIKEAGHLRVEGHDYEIRDGDIVHFRFAT